MPFVGVVGLFLVPWCVLAAQLWLIEAIAGTTHHYWFWDTDAPWQPVYHHWGYFWRIFIPMGSQLALAVAAEFAVCLLATRQPPIPEGRGPALAVASVVLALGFPVIVAVFYRTIHVIPGGWPLEWWPFWLGWPVFLVSFLALERLFSGQR